MPKIKHIQQRHNLLDLLIECPNLKGAYITQIKGITICDCGKIWDEGAKYSAVCTECYLIYLEQSTGKKHIEALGQDGDSPILVSILAPEDSNPYTESHPDVEYDYRDNIYQIKPEVYKKQHGLFKESS